MARSLPALSAALRRSGRFQAQAQQPERKRRVAALKTFEPGLRELGWAAQAITAGTIVKRRIIGGTPTAQSAVPAKTSGISHSRRYPGIHSGIVRSRWGTETRPGFAMIQKSPNRRLFGFSSWRGTLIEINAAVHRWLIYIKP